MIKAKKHSLLAPSATHVTRGQGCSSCFNHHHLVNLPTSREFLQCSILVHFCSTAHHSPRYPCVRCLPLGGSITVPLTAPLNCTVWPTLKLVFGFLWSGKYSTLS